MKGGDRVVVKWSDGPVMAYLVSYYNGYNDYAICSDNADGSDQFIAPRRHVSKAPAEPTPPVANIQVFEATKRPEKDFWAANNQRRTNPTTKEA